MYWPIGIILYSLLTLFLRANDFRIEKTTAGSVESTLEQPVQSPLAEMTVPPQKALEDLLQLVERNRVRQLRSQLDTLKETDRIYVPFADSLLVLARQFRAEDIETQLRQYLTTETPHG